MQTSQEMNEVGRFAFSKVYLYSHYFARQIGSSYRYGRKQTDLHVSYGAIGLERLSHHKSSLRYYPYQRESDVLIEKFKTEKHVGLMTRQSCSQR